jgi:hypothetical protein
MRELYSLNVEFVLKVEMLVTVVPKGSASKGLIVSTRTSVSGSPASTMGFAATIPTPGGTPASVPRDIQDYIASWSCCRLESFSPPGTLSSLLLSVWFCCSVSFFFLFYLSLLQRGGWTVIFLISLLTEFFPFI